MGVSSSKAEDGAADRRGQAADKAHNANQTSHRQYKKTSSQLRKLLCFRSTSEDMSSGEPFEEQENDHTSSSEKERPESPTASVDREYSEDEKTRSEPFSHDYELHCLKKAGIYIERQTGNTALTTHGRDLCRKLSNIRYATPEKSIYEGDNLFRVLETARTCNYTRLFRDLTPLLVPSPEHLFWTGLSSVDYLTERLSERWHEIVPATEGPRIRPDISVGLHPAAFSEKELKQLDDYHSAAAPARFCREMYFPFFTCDLSNGLYSSERKNARSAATAIHAIMEVHAAGDYDLAALSHEVLFFSVSHDAAFVEIFAHYPVIEEENTMNIYCHLVRSFDLNDDDGRNRWTSYNYIRAIYEHFSKMHLKRIREAIIRLPDEKARKRGATASLSSMDTAVECEGHAKLRCLESVLASIPRNLFTDKNKTANWDIFTSFEKRQRNGGGHEGKQEQELRGRLRGILREIEELSREQECEREKQMHEQKAKDESRLEATSQQNSSSYANDSNDSNRHCINCTGCKNCSYCVTCVDSIHCSHSINLTDCRSCVRCTNCQNCQNCSNLINSSDQTDRHGMNDLE